MQFKTSLILAGIAAGASGFTLPTEGDQGMTQAQEYVIRNMDQVCVSTRPVPMCQEDYVVKSYKNQKINFFCLSRNSLEGQRLIQKVEDDQVIPEMSGKTAHVQGRVQVPTKCVEKSQVSGQEQRRRKQQQQHGQRVELIEDGQQQQFDQENQWETEQDELTNEERYSQYRQHRFQEENDWQKMHTLFTQYPELTQKSLHQIVKTSPSQYKQVAEQLKELVQQKQVNSHLVPQIQNTLPTFFSQVAKQLYEAKEEEKEQTEQGKRTMQYGQDDEETRLQHLVGDYEQYKQLMQRVYVYVTKETLKLNQEAPRRLSNTNELVRKVWNKIQSQELTKRQIEKINETVEKIQELLQLDQTNQMIADELVSEQLKSSQRQARKNLMRIIVAGLMMEKNSSYESVYTQN